MDKIFIKTYGCAHNQADSEFMAGLLSQAKYQITNSIEDSNLVIINTCTVKDPSEKKFFTQLERIKKPIVIAGCIPQADKENPKLKEFSLLGVKQIHRVLEAVDKTLNGEKIKFLDTKGLTLNLPKIRRNPVVEIVPISNGCLGACTFCKTKQARGVLDSFPLADIITQIRVSLDEGVKEIWLTSEDLGAYGLDIKSSLPELLTQILKIQKDFKLRLGMMNPEYVKKYADQLIEILKDDRIFKFIHCPVQSGNNKVLKNMKRKYLIEDYKTSINKLKSAIPNLTVSTDIICGFPQETDEEFNDTLELVKEFKFPVLNISKFYPRPNTPAIKMGILPTHIVKERSLKLTKLKEKVVSNDSWIDWEGNILVDEFGKEGVLIGRNFAYKHIVVSNSKDKSLLGKIIKIKIISATTDYLISETI